MTEPAMILPGMSEKAPDAYRTISEVAAELALPQHVLRFWESRFTQIKPLKRGGGRRYYRPDDIALLKGIQHLLYNEGYTIKGVQKVLKTNGVRFVQGRVSEPRLKRVFIQDNHRESLAAAEVETRVTPGPPPADLQTPSHELPLFSSPVPKAEAKAGIPNALLIEKLRALREELLACRKLIKD